MFIKVVELWWCYGGAGPVSPRTLNAACLRDMLAVIILNEQLKFLNNTCHCGFCATSELLVICARLQELVETSDAKRLVDTSSVDTVCLEETVDVSGMPVGLPVDSSVSPSTTAREDDFGVKPASSLDTVQQTGTELLADIILLSTFDTVSLIFSECDSTLYILMNFSFAFCNRCK